MKIALAQLESIKSDIQGNIAKHVDLIERAVEQQVDAIFFPELSIINYEPSIARAFSMSLNDERFEFFQELSDLHEIVIGIGVPLIVEDGVRISMILFQPSLDCLVYSKQTLHEDEIPYFSPGVEHVQLTIKGVKVGLGICYEALQKNHMIEVVNNGANVFLASVAKSKEGVEKAYSYFSDMATELNVPILMVNNVGPCDNFIGAGQSAVWNSKGEIINALDSKSNKVLLYSIDL